MLACELVAAVRALRMRPADLLDRPVRDAFDLADATLDTSTADRPFSDDLTKAAALLEPLSDI